MYTCQGSKKSVGCHFGQNVVPFEKVSRLQGIIKWYVKFWIELSCLSISKVQMITDVSLGLIP